MLATKTLTFATQPWSNTGIANFAGVGCSWYRRSATTRRFCSEDPPFFSPADVGQTHSITPSDPRFAPMASALTNGQQDEFFWYTFTVSHGGTINSRGFSGSPEGTFFKGQLAPGAFDFAGYDLTAIRETLDSLSIGDLPSPVPGGPPRKDILGTVTLTFEGTPTPEPATAATLLAACAGPLLLSRRRLQHPR